MKSCEVAAVQDLGRHRVKKVSASSGWWWPVKQPDVVQFHLLPGFLGQLGGLELVLQPLGGFVDAQVIELDALALRALLAVPIGLLEARLRTGAGSRETGDSGRSKPSSIAWAMSNAARVAQRGRERRRCAADGAGRPPEAAPPDSLAGDRAAARAQRPIASSNAPVISPALGTVMRSRAAGRAQAVDPAVHHQLLAARQASCTTVVWQTLRACSITLSATSASTCAPRQGIEPGLVAVAHVLAHGGFSCRPGRCGCRRARRARPPQPEWPTTMMCLIFSRSVANWITDRQFRSECTTTLATLRCTNNSPGSRFTRSFAGTRLSAQPIHRYCGACCWVSPVKKPGRDASVFAAHRRLLSRSSWSEVLMAVLQCVKSFPSVRIAARAAQRHAPRRRPRRATGRREPASSGKHQPIKVCIAGFCVLIKPGHHPRLTNEELAPLKEQTWTRYNIFAFWMSDVHSVGATSPPQPVRARPVELAVLVALRSRT